MAIADDRLKDLRARLLAEFEHGRRQRLYGLLSSAFREQLETIAAEQTAATAVAAYLLLQAVVVHVARRADLAGPLARDLPRALRVESPLDEFLTPEVGLVYAETQRYRQQATLPPSLMPVDTECLSRLAVAAADALRDLPAPVWDALVLSTYRPAPERSHFVVVVPPRLGERQADAPRPAPGPFPAEAAAVTPDGAMVVDARAERLWPDEALAAVLAVLPPRPPPEQPPPSLTAAEATAAIETVMPTVVAVVEDAATEPGEVGAFATALMSVAPWVRLWRPAVTPDLREVLATPFLELLAPNSEVPFYNLAAWPLACYRREPADADVVVPVAGRDGAELARTLASLGRRFTAARVRLDAGLTATQATELAAAMPRPGPPVWSLRLREPSVPGDPAALRAAGLRAVVLDAGATGVPASLLPVVAEALREVSLAVQLTVDTTGHDPRALVADVLAAAPDAVSWIGEEADTARHLWSAAQ